MKLSILIELSELNLMLGCMNLKNIAERMAQQGIKPPKNDIYDAIAVRLDKR